MQPASQSRKGQPRQSGVPIQFVILSEAKDPSAAPQDDKNESRAEALSGPSWYIRF
jgi:hypothetical protein